MLVEFLVDHLKKNMPSYLIFTNTGSSFYLDSYADLNDSEFFDKLKELALKYA